MECSLASPNTTFFQRFMIFKHGMLSSFPRKNSLVLADVLKTGPASEPVKLLVHGSTGRIGPTTGPIVLL